MSLIESLEKEVSDNANQMTAEVVLLLLDKWEHDLDMAMQSNKAEIPELLNYYVRLKISFHHAKRAQERGWSLIDEDKVKLRISLLATKIKEARKKYYVAKQRFESDKHGSKCSCRGCRCLKGIDGGSSDSASQGSN
jgi:hypothetical protein